LLHAKIKNEISDTTTHFDDVLYFHEKEIQIVWTCRWWTDDLWQKIKKAVV